MRFFAKAAVSVALAMVTAGCIKVEARTSIEPDGSGESHLRVTVASEVLGVMSLNGDLSPAEVCSEMRDESSDNGWGLGGAGGQSATSWGLNRDGECSVVFSDEWGADGSARKLREHGIARTESGGYRYEWADDAPPAIPPYNDEEKFLALFHGMLSEDATPEAAFSITMPGGAEECGKTTFSWGFGLLSMESAAVLEAETDGDESSGCGQSSGTTTKVVMLIVLLSAFASGWAIYYGIKRVKAGALDNGNRVADADDSR